jgi:hypothetical protein
MLKSIITSEVRIKLLLKFFLNPGNQAYLRQLSGEFGESTNGIRVELNRLVEANILNTETRGRNKLYKANSKHPLFEEIRNIVLKSTGIEKVISNIINKLGDVEVTFIRGDYAEGRDTGLIELVVVGNKINKAELERVRKKTEKLIDRKISIIILNSGEFSSLKNKFMNEPNLILMKGKK